jgi:predicted MFS family arabinose efflux permease
MNDSQKVFNLSKYQILVIILLAFTQFTVVLDFMVMSPLGDMLMKSMGLSTKQFGMVVSAYALSAGASGLLTAGFADRFDRKKLLLFFYIGFIIGTLFCGIATNYHFLLFARVFTGIFGGVIGSISLAIVADIFLPQQRGRVMGYMQMGFGASQVLGIPISLFLANTYKWEIPFFMIVGIAVIIWIIIVFKMKPINEHLATKSEKNPFKHMLHTFSNKEYQAGFLATALLSLGGFMMMPWSSAYSINNLKITNEQLVPLFMVAGIASLIIMPIVGKQSDKMDRYKLFTIASIWMVIIVLIYTNLVPIPLWLLMIVNILLMIGILSRMVPSMALVTSLPRMEDRGAFMSINSSLQQIAGGIAAAVGGIIVYQKDKDSPIEHFNVLGIVMVFIVTLNIYFVYRVNAIIKNRKKESHNL